MQQDIHIPDNIAKYVDSRDGTVLEISFNNASALGGILRVMWQVVKIKAMTRTCRRCGYDPLWNPNDAFSPCNRHSYGNWRYDEVFVWSAEGNDVSLEEAFDQWLNEQPDPRSYEPVKMMSFGQIGW